MKIKLIAVGFIALTASLSGCVVAPAYDGGPGYVAPGAVIVAPVYRGYYGPYYGGYRGHYYRRW